MRKTILFRADGNANIGLGHLYRLFSLIEIVKEKYDFIFVTKADSSLSVFEKTIAISLIPNTISIEKEASWLKENFSPSNHIIVADGYQFTSTYQKEVKEEGFSLIYVDDLATEYMLADIVVNHSPGLSEKDYKKQDNTKLALGTNYALLRPTFLKLAESSRHIAEIKTAFVCFGGADPYNLTLKALKAIVAVNGIDIIHVVLGGAYKHDKINTLDIETNKKLNIHRNLSEAKMAEVMLASDMAIVPSSTILYELCCIKMPILSGFFVDNQKRIYNGFLEKNAIFGMGDIKDFSEVDFRNALKTIIEKDNFKNQLLAQGQLFDHKIRDRYLELIESLC